MLRLSGPTDYALVTLAELKTYMNITGAAQDAFLQVLLDGVHRSWHTLVGGRFVKDTGTSYDDLVDSNGANEIYLPEFPVVSISSLQHVIMAGNDTFQVKRTYTTTEYQLDKPSGRLIGTNFSYWPSARDILRAQYRAGYATTPGDVREAVCQWVAIRFARASDRRHDQLSVTHEGDSVSFTRNDYSEAIEETARNYRRLEATIG